jgi:hypothetical protein
VTRFAGTPPRWTLLAGALEAGALALDGLVLDVLVAEGLDDERVGELAPYAAFWPHDEQGRELDEQSERSGWVGARADGRWLDQNESRGDDW